MESEEREIELYKKYKGYYSYGVYIARKLGATLIPIEPKFQNQDEFNDGDLVCYCFEFTKKDIENDFIENGKSLIHEKIAAAKKAGGCHCALKNPKGR